MSYGPKDPPEWAWCALCRRGHAMNKCPSLLQAGNSVMIEGRDEPIPLLSDLAGRAYIPRQQQPGPRATVRVVAGRKPRRR